MIVSPEVQARAERARRIETGEELVKVLEGLKHELHLIMMLLRDGASLHR